MGLSTLLVIIGIVIFILVLIMFPEARSLLQGFTRLFIKDMASTPEGAEAIYTEKINDAIESYNKVDDSYKKAAGRLEVAKRDLANLKDRLKRVEAECESLVRNNNMDAAQIKADEREEIQADIARTESLINGYAAAAEQAKEARDLCEANLRKLKRESKEIVSNMKVKQQLKEVYDDMDDLKSVTGTDRMIDSIREKNQDLDAIVEGSRASHSNRMSTKVQRAEAAARQSQSSDYLESLKKKYGK